MNESVAPEAGKDSNPSPVDFAHGVCSSLSPKGELGKRSKSENGYSSRTMKQATQPDLNTF